jgi:hypothetical protein
MLEFLPDRFPRPARQAQAVPGERPLLPATQVESRRPRRVVWMLAAACLVALPARDFPASTSGAPPALLATPSGGSRSQVAPIPAPRSSKQDTTPRPDLAPNGISPLTKKQQQELLKSNFEKLKRDADELAALAKSLQQDLDKSNENVLSLKVLDRAEKIEKLAKKIRSEAKSE